MKSSEQIFRTIFENASDGIVLVDTESKKFFMGNRQVYIDLGYSPEEFKTLGVSDIHPEKDLPYIFDQFDKMKRNEILLSKDIPVKRKDGSIYYADISAIPTPLIGKSLTIGIFRDVTQRKQLEEALEKNEKLLNATQLLSKVGGWEWDVDKQTMTWTEETYHLHDMIPGDLNPGSPEHVEMSISCYTHEDRIKIKEAFRLCSEEGIPYDMEVPFTSTKGRAMWIRTMAKAVLSEGHVMKVIGNIMDITERKRSEEALKEKSHFIASLLRAIPVAVFYKDREGRYLGCNDSFTEIMGVTDDQIRGKTVHELWPSELAEKYHQMDLELMRNREHQVYEFQVKAKDSQMHPVIYAKDVFLDKDGDVAGLVGAFLDITERKQVEEALRQSEERFRVAQELSLYAFTILSPVRDYNGIIVDFRWDFVNREAGRILGHAPEDLVGRRLLDVLPGNRTNCDLFERYVHVAETGESHDYELCYESEGIHGWFRNMAVKLGDSIAVSFTDISERKLSEKTLKENLELLAEAERIGLTGSWKRDLTTNNIIWSSGTYRIFGIPENEEISLETIKTLIHPEDRDFVLGKLEEAEKKGTSINVEFRIIHHDGKIRTLSSKGEVTYGPGGKPILIHGTVQDITERRRLEDYMIKSQKLDSIGTLAGGLAHDYNNLLSAIMGNVDLAKMLITKNDQAHAVLMKAEQAILKARDLTQQLSTFSRGGYPLSKIIDIRDCLTQSVRLALSGSNIRPEWNIEEDLPDVKVDENQIRLVIQNIVINAREAMPLGGNLFIDANKVLLKPDNTLFLPENTYIRLAFRDEGMGIPADNLHKVFDPYFTTKDMGAIKGMGLGLSICYSIIKRHLGHIMLESKEGVGTTVIIHLPAAMVHIEL